MLDEKAVRKTSPWALMIEQNSITCIHFVRLAVVHHYPICIQFGHTCNPSQINVVQLHTII